MQFGYLCDGKGCLNGELGGLRGSHQSLSHWSLKALFALCGKTYASIKDKQGTGKYK